jgi:hypothetical protein
VKRLREPDTEAKQAATCIVAHESDAGSSRL